MTKIRFHEMVAGLAMLATPAACVSQAAPTVAESAARARAILDSAIAAHGGIDALRAAQRIRVTLDGQDFWRNQSARVAPPYDSRDATVEFMLDLAASRLVLRQSGAYPGDTPFSTRRVTDGERALEVFEQFGVHNVERVRPIDNQTMALFMHLPQLALLAAQENRATVRSLGRLRLASGVTVDALSVNTATGPMAFGFDTATRRFRAILDAQADPVAGDVSVEKEFVDYRPLYGVLLPSRRLTWIAGEKTQELRYVAATPDYTIPDSLLSIPPASKALVNEAPGDAVRELAPGVWSIRQFGSHVLAVVFKDYVVVVETPGGTTKEIAAEVAKVAPGKPIRYVVPTHHHDDHSSGIREYVGAGATIVTTPGNRAYFERMIAARSTLEPNAAVPARTPSIEVITTGRRVFTDGTRTLELHDIGPNKHADEMLVAWIPDAGIVYEADMINTAPNGDVVQGANSASTVSFAEAIKRRGWNVRLYAGTHHPPLPPAVLAAILLQPIAQP